MTEGGGADLELLVEVGHPGWYPGLAQVRVDGTGAVAALQTFAAAGETARTLDLADDGWGTQPGVVRGRMEAAHAEDLMAHAAGFFPWERPFPTRPGIPDEAVVVVRFGPRGGPHRALRIWLREADDDPDVGVLLHALRGILGELSPGSIIL